MHEPSNIEVSREKFQCLRPTAWLNDEVNIYLEYTYVRKKTFTYIYGLHGPVMVLAYIILRNDGMYFSLFAGH